MVMLSSSPDRATSETGLLGLQQELVPKGRRSHSPELWLGHEVAESALSACIQGPIFHRVRDVAPNKIDSIPCHALSDSEKHS
ncbi:hypothetical protein Ahy_A05g024255 isoform C [Arachis hypogaea]|uniref:Uncharacterized protein n=1 Tax=Arachis hypogaea TaxID=3818 RepID=A0A445D5F7_ARAHY|nr:hypothetical protein Ahy_A05g024255 isoform C [Arachis hypogaea]